MHAIASKNIRRIGLFFFLFLTTTLPVWTREDFAVNERTLQKMEQRYGTGARKRLAAWQDMLKNAGKDSETEQLDKVNRFFNKLPYIEDTDHWGREDYWATPVEFIASNGGDCEDFAIAKYFSLAALGIDESKLALTYVKALRYNRAHMVLTYYPTPGAEPLVLDNLAAAIQRSSKRTDLLPVYSLNGSGLWLAKQQGKGKQVGSSSRLKRWQEMIDRMGGEFN